MESASQKVSTFIRSKRAAIEMTQPELALKVFGKESYKNYISRIESGRREITLCTLRRILQPLKSEVVITSDAGESLIGCEDKEVGPWIRNQRESLGMSQTKLAKAVYGNEEMKSYISAIETGRRSPSIVSLGYILTALKSEISFIE